MDVPWKKIEVCTLRFAMLVWRQRLCKKVGKRTSSVNNWKEWKVVQAKKTGNRKKDVFVSILFLYLEKHLYKIFIYNMLLYIKITFSSSVYEKSTTSFTSLLTSEGGNSGLSISPHADKPSSIAQHTPIKYFIIVLLYCC